MSVMPRIADISLTKVQFAPGDRVIVRTHAVLDVEEKKKLARSIKRWAGCDVRVLIYSTAQLDIQIENQYEV